MSDTEHTQEVLEPGERSHGTMRDQDIAEMLKAATEEVHCDACLDFLADVETYITEVYVLDMFSGSLLQEAIQELWDVLEMNHTPEDHYFGAIEGDGACYGVWPLEEEEEL